MTATADHAAVKTLAKAIFASTYNYPRVRYRSIGRKAFAWALNRARAEIAALEAERARIAAMSAAEKAARIAALREHAELAEFADSYPAVVSARAAVAAEIARLSS